MKKIIYFLYTMICASKNFEVSVVVVLLENINFTNALPTVLLKMIVLLEYNY